MNGRNLVEQGCWDQEATEKYEEELGTTGMPQIKDTSENGDRNDNCY